MSDSIKDRFVNIELSTGDFRRLASFIHEQLGIRIPDFKRGMVESRLRKRLNTLGMNSYKDYCDYLFSKNGMNKEVYEFTDVITTNKTDFFREPHHFSYLSEKAVPELVSRIGAGRSRPFKVWSCACSRGDEPYTIAMVLNEYKKKEISFDFNILATDISTRMLTTAAKGVYDDSVIQPIPHDYRKKYLLKSKDRSKGLIRIRPEIRNKVVFRRLNLMNKDYRLGVKFDVLFCRNVIIYFDKPTTEKLIFRLCQVLTPGGYLFMGHSELLDVGLYPLVQVAPTIYKKV